MKSLLFLLSVASCMSCSESDFQIIQGKWKFEYYETQNSKEYPPAESNPVFLKFNSNRKFYGSSLCNVYWGNYLEFEDIKLNILSLQSTDQTCNNITLSNWEQVYFQNLKSVIYYETNGTTLTLYTRNPLIKIVFTNE